MSPIDPDEARRLRAAARAGWPIRKVGLDDIGEDLSDVTTAEERLAMMERLALDAWACAGLQWPRYVRADMPGRLVRRRHG
jgi:hypothetical protein